MFSGLFTNKKTTILAILASVAALVTMVVIPWVSVGFAGVHFAEFVTTLLSNFGLAAAADHSAPPVVG